MIVNKPQFDTERIKPGQAYWLTKKDFRKFKEMDQPCIIKAVKPLTIVVGFHSNKLKGWSELTIDISSVVNGTFKFEEMSIMFIKEAQDGTEFSI